MNMNHKDALHILGVTSKSSIEDIKLAYRKACSAYHPDRNPAGLEMMKLVNAAYESLAIVLNGGQFDKSIAHETDGTEHYGRKINDALSAIINLNLTIEICGSWVWVSGDTRAHKDILKEAGFKWAPIKKMWHFRPEEYKSFSRGKWDMDKIREKHGSLNMIRKNYRQLDNCA